MLNKDNKKEVYNTARLMGLGIEFASIILTATFVGVYLDKKFNKMPLFTILGLFSGFAFGLYNIFRIAKIINKKDK